MLVVFAKAPRRQNNKSLKRPSTRPTHTSPRRETIIDNEELKETSRFAARFR